MYSTREAFELYVYYLAVKRHFTNAKYDFFKYQGKVNASRQSFENRRDKYQFYKLSKMKHAKELILANLIQNPSMWIGDMFTDEANQVYLDWLKRQQSITYRFKSDINQMDDDFDSNFIVQNGQYPRVLQLYNRGQISLETLAILTDLVRCQKHWEKNIFDTVLFPDINRTLSKVKPFLTYDKEKLRQILLDRYTAA